MNSEMIELIANLLPVAVNITKQVLSVAQDAKDNGFEIPRLDEIESLNDQLKKLKDL